MHPQLSGHAPRCTRQAQQKGGEAPVGEGALAAVQERAREGIEGALADLRFPAVAWPSRLVGGGDATPSPWLSFSSDHAFG
jgi:hypothetical protein